ncbi:MAG: M48 family metalloprotease [Alphaproteobacteria bacterium]|nr:M48 family metalloprotease [Alphaproteobacteria bacterium]
MPEDKAFLIAHELGHQAARHLSKARAIAILATTASYTGFANFILTTFSNWTGWMAPASGMGIALGSSWALPKVLPDSVWNKHGPVLKFASPALGIGAILGVSYLSHNPQIAAAWGMALATNLTAKMVYAGYSRENEFQADRIGAETIGNPQQAAISLQNIHEHLQVNADKAAAGTALKKTLILWAFERAKELFSESPLIDKRIKRLERMSMTPPMP